MGKVQGQKPWTFLVYGINLIDDLNVCKYNNCAYQNVFTNAILGS